MRTALETQGLEIPSLPHRSCSHDLLSVMYNSSMPTTRYLMIKVAYHRPMSSPACMGIVGPALDTNVLEDCLRDKQGGENIEELWENEPQV